MTHGPQCVLFDIGNVLIDWNPYVLFEELIPDDEERKHFHEVVCPREWWVRHDAGASFEEIAEPVCERFPDKRDLIWAWHDRYLDLIPGAIEGSVQILRELKQNSVRVHALTNWASDKFQIARKEYDFLELFDDIVVSGDVGMVKPNPKIFRLALNRLPVGPESTVFIDDHEPNIAAANALGLITHHFTNPKTLRKNLAQCGLL